MGGHGGLNILPQKRWNVYNFDNREKVRKDEEQAAKDEQLKREQSRKRDAELRLLQLRRSRGLAPPPAAASSPPPESVPELVPEQPEKSNSKHINLFEGIKIFDPVVVEKRREDGGEERRKRRKKEEEVRVVGPEDEKYRLGYGVAGKGVKAPWYTVRRVVDEVERDEEVEEVRREKKKRKKTVEELREERLKREKAEKERERALMLQKTGRGGDRGRMEYRDRYYCHRR